MIRSFILGLAVSLLFGNCSGQTGTKQVKEQKNKPVTNYKVNKEYDDNGNLIRYDSTYSYYYSNVEGDTIMQDSIYDAFRDSFNNHFYFSEDPFFNNFFFQDSLLPYDFYKKDFFSNRYKFNPDQFDQLFMQMDSIKNEFFGRQFKELKAPPQANNPNKAAKPIKPNKADKPKGPVYDL